MPGQTTCHTTPVPRPRSPFPGWPWRLLPVLLAVAVPVLAHAVPPSPAPKAGAVRTLEAGTEMWATLDHLEVQTFNEGVMEKPEDRIRRTHEPARQEKWQFGQQFEEFTYDGRRFTGRWRSTDFQAEYFTEYVLVEGELAPDGASVKTMTLTRLRFERPSAEPPEQRGFVKIVLRFENLLHNTGLGNSVTYRFVPGRSRVVIESAVGDFLSTESHSQTRTTWKGLAPFTGPNEVTGQPRGIFASVTFETWGRQAPPPPEPRKGSKTVRVTGDSKLAAEVIAWLAKRPGVRIADGTARVDAAIRQERALAAAGLLEEGTGPGARAPEMAFDAVLDMTSIGTDPRDISTRVTLRPYDADSESFVEAEMNFDLEMDRYLKLGDAAFGDWVRLRRDQFVGQLFRMLEQQGL